MGSSSRKRPRLPQPAWLKWLLLAFIAYAVLMSSLPGQRAHQEAQKAGREIAAHPMLQLSDYKDKIFPEFGAGLRINDVETGSGPIAFCGQKVTVAYESFLAQGNPLPDHAGKGKPLRFTLGDGHVMPVFDRGVIGMKVGGKRSIIASPLMSYGLEDYHRDDVPKGAAVRFEMELLSADPTLPDTDTLPYRIANLSDGNGAALNCGDEVSVRLQMWDLRGKLLYSNMKDATPLTFRLGASQVMFGLEQGVVGMLEQGRRLLIIPPEFQKTLTGRAPEQALPIPSGQVIILEVMASGIMSENKQ